MHAQPDLCHCGGRWEGGKIAALTEVNSSPWIHECFPQGVWRLAYASPVDGEPDWALMMPGPRREAWLVCLHGHGSKGDQLFTRADIRDGWLPGFRRLGLGVLTPNLRGNAWMSAPAAADLRALLAWMRDVQGAERFYFASGSMGGTGSLLYAVVHPEDVAALAALCPASDLAAYHEWCGRHPGGVRDEIRQAIAAAYGGPPTEVPAAYAAHSAWQHADRLTMPVLVVHGTADASIPVEQSRHLAALLAHSPRFTYRELAGGDHEAPLLQGGMLEWLADRDRS
ncbi:MAG: alpha/beta fold hydrolase [Gemmatimonadota bacterium]